MLINQFEKEIIKELNRKNLAVFAGAGLSMGTGFVSWKELIRDIAEEIGLDVDKEYDMISIAQYYYNSKNRNRNKINEKILNQFRVKTKESNYMNIIARLPINTYWTTNYDQLIEKTLENVDKIVDIKKDKNDLSIFLDNRDVVLYKIHGDVNVPNDAVIIRDDYERFNEKRSLFITNLIGDLVSKTFLFIGYSFGDPNFEHILSKIRFKLEENQRTHYAFMKKISRSDYKDDEEEKYIYDSTKRKLRIEDLKNYHIEVIEVDKYDEITESLKRIEQELRKNNIFISGSAYEYNEFGNIDEASNFIRSLSENLVSKDFRIVSGYGLGVGGYVIEGVSNGIFAHELDVEKHFILKPFPQKPAKGQDRKKVWNAHRHQMISQCEISIFMFGNKLSKSGTTIVADGVISEFEIANELGVFVIPIGSTGYRAKEIFETVKNDKQKYWYLVESLDTLEKTKDSKVILNEIINIIERIRRGK